MQLKKGITKKDIKLKGGLIITSNNLYKTPTTSN